MVRTANSRMVKVYLASPREQIIFERVKEALGEDDTGTFTYVLKNYAEKMNLISEELHNRKG